MIPKKYWWFTDIPSLRPFFDRHPFLDVLFDLITCTGLVIGQIILALAIYSQVFFGSPVMPH